MTAGIADAVYIDVMVFVYFLLSPRYYGISQKSRAFFKDIQDGKYVGKVSTFSVMEYVGVAKAIISEQRKKEITHKETLAVKDTILQFIRDMGIELYDADELVVQQDMAKCSLFSESESLLENATPMLGRNDGKWHSLKGADSLHLVFALRTNAEYFATFDDDFRGVKNTVRTLMINEEY